MRPSAGGRIGTLALGVMLGVGCAKDTHPPAYQGGTTPADMDAGADAGGVVPIDGFDASAPPSPDAAGYCGNQFLPVVSTRKNLYLVLDRSGSMRDTMTDPVTGNPIRKYDASLRAIHDVLFALGHRLAYGAAVFPQLGDVESCNPGTEINVTAPGDAVTYALSGKDGPKLAKLMYDIGLYIPEGSTPTSATLEGLVGKLIALGSDTSVILATDGAPNCNVDISCDSAHCIPNIEGWWLDQDIKCTSALNCCDKTLSGGGNCIDADATVAPIAKLFAAGIRTYVIGLPGSEAYESVLNRLATAGGTARPKAASTDLAYYPVNDAAQLTQSLKGIAAELAISCTIALDSPPPDWTQVNVYFDNTLIKMNVDNGWTQLNSHTVEITGSYCDLLKSGDVFQVQVVSGCPTEVLI